MAEVYNLWSVLYSHVLYWLLTDTTDVSKEDSQNSLSLQDSAHLSGEERSGDYKEEGTGRCGLEPLVTLLWALCVWLVYTSDSTVLYSCNHSYI